MYCNLLLKKNKQITKKTLPFAFSLSHWLLLKKALVLFCPAFLKASICFFLHFTVS